MTPRLRGIAVLAVQLVLVLSIAAKYAWERHTCPMVWTRTAQVDPELPLRGRYLALGLRASACNLKLSEGQDEMQWTGSQARTQHTIGKNWDVIPAASNGKLAPIVSPASQPEDRQTLTLLFNQPCDYARLSGTTDFFIAEHAKTPFPLAKGEELWAQVTIPPSGPPRPVRLAVSNGHDFRVLDLR